MIQFTKETLGHLEAALTREWLETNGLGGFASSTIIGLNTRRYHGLLLAATKPPVGRILMLSKLEETLVLDGRRFELSSNQYPGIIHPQGYLYQTAFRLDPFPVFTYEVEGVRLEKSVFMPEGENTTIIQYQLFVPRSESQEKRNQDGFIPHPSSLIPSLEVRPLIAFRDYHSLSHETPSINPRVQMEHARLTFAPDENLPPLHFAHDAEVADAAGYWYRSFEYREERERGFDDTEDLFSPFVLKFDLRRRTEGNIIASTVQHAAHEANTYREAESSRRKSVLTSSPTSSFVSDELVTALVAAADKYIVARGSGKTVIAGYHWFSDWGRDTMIALPGLTLVTGRAEEARSILLAFARHVDRGMLPNRFPDAGESPEYNNVDATLWFFEAIRALLTYTNDYEFVRANLYDVLTGIIDWHMRGTRYNIRVDADGLLASGEEGLQLTWMDAKIGDLVVTPRRGKPVEIQALWYNALCVMEHLARQFNDAARRKLYEEMAAHALRNFDPLFWNEAAGCLYDVIDEEGRDPSIRPNQIFAVSLPFTMLTRERARRVLEVVERDLLTPYGLRSLAPSDPRYRATYEGDAFSRDTAYHQGTVWGWLMGPFITAYIKIHGRTPVALERVALWLAPFQKHLHEAGLGQVSEIFDGDAPHSPRGCIAQAWSVAELLRVASNDFQ
ncbi:MAG TPA: amylo-alpha-1,6-glucosidase [Pyrinomonadaceae bacterium]|jgi:predicted glycogen debranching enzyme